MEDGQPFVEEQVKRALSSDYEVKGCCDGNFATYFESTPDNVGEAIGWGIKRPFGKPQGGDVASACIVLGCGSLGCVRRIEQGGGRTVPDARIFGDIGCYTLNALPPFRAIDSCCGYGVSITMAKGASDAGVFPAIALIGDSTFTHSGMTGSPDAVQ